MSEVPTATPVSTPVEEIIVATDVLPLIHVPPAVASLSVMAEPMHTPGPPVMAAGSGLTVTAVVMIQVVGSVYVMVALPGATPVTTPVPEVTVAIAVLLLLHVPPKLPSDNINVDPWQKGTLPDMAAGNGLTVAVTVRIQPVGSV